MVGIDAVGLARAEERAVHGNVLCRIVRSGKEPVLASQGDGPDGILHQVVVDLKVAIVQVGHHVIPQAYGIADGFADG